MGSESFTAVTELNITSGLFQVLPHPVPCIPPPSVPHSSICPSSMPMRPDQWLHGPPTLVGKNRLSLLRGFKLFSPKEMGSGMSGRHLGP